MGVNTVSWWWSRNIANDFRSAAVVHDSKTIFIDPDEPANISSFTAVESRQSIPLSFWLNDIASSNIFSMVVTLETDQGERSMLNAVARLNIPSISRTADTFHCEISALNDRVRANMLLISSTLDTSHLEMSALK